MRPVTFSRGVAIVITTPTRVLTKNPFRQYYMLQNHDLANYVAFGPRPTVTAGGYTTNEGTHLAPGQPVTDNSDKDEVWVVADTATVNITVVEVSLLPDARHD
jgi:hypothetical protein